MVHIYSVSIINKTELKILNSTYELGQFSFWEKSTIRELCNFVSIECTKRCDVNNFSCLERLEFICYVRVYVENDESIAVACVCDLEYPVRIIQVFIKKAYQLYSKRNIVPISELNSTIEELFDSYQSPEICHTKGTGVLFVKFLEDERAKEYKMDKIKNELDTIRMTGIDAINKLYIRDDELSDLILKTDELSDVSIQFAKASDGMNRCCNLF